MEYEEFCENRERLERAGIPYFAIMIWQHLYDEHPGADISQGEATGVVAQIWKECPEWKTSPLPKGFDARTDPTVKRAIETFWRERGLLN